MLTDVLYDPNHKAAERILHASCGPNMFTWFVGHHPVGHYSYTFRKQAPVTQPTTSPLRPLIGEKTFFMKGRVTKGQADPTGNTMDVEDFKWLSKEEIQKEVTAQYWASIKNMLVAQ
jgi:large subunit ribosomal protein L46